MFCGVLLLNKTVKSRRCSRWRPCAIILGSAFSLKARDSWISDSSWMPWSPPSPSNAAFSSELWQFFLLSCHLSLWFPDRYPPFPVFLWLKLSSHRSAFTKLKGVCSLIILLGALELILFILSATSELFRKAATTHCQIKYLICQQHTCELIIIQ